MKVIYTFEDRTRIESEFDLDPRTEQAIRNARSKHERHLILDPLIAEHAMSEEQQVDGGHHRDIDFGIDGGRYDQ